MRKQLFCGFHYRLLTHNHSDDDDNNSDKNDTDYY